MTAIADRVDQQCRRPMHVADDDVDVAVVVDVAERRAAADRGLTEDRAALRADVFEPPVPEIAEQQISLVVAGTAR